MKKSDLKTGMLVETRVGEIGLIMKDNAYGEDAVVFHENSWTGLVGFDENTLEWSLESRDPNNTRLTKHCLSVDIMKVYKPDLPTGFLSRKNNFSRELTLIWEREKVKEYTM